MTSRLIGGGLSERPSSINKGQSGVVHVRLHSNQDSVINHESTRTVSRWYNWGFHPSVVVQSAYFTALADRVGDLRGWLASFPLLN